MGATSQLELLANVQIPPPLLDPIFIDLKVAFCDCTKVQNLKNTHHGELVLSQFELASSKNKHICTNISGRSDLLIHVHHALQSREGYIADVVVLGHELRLVYGCKGKTYGHPTAQGLFLGGFGRGVLS